MKPDISAIKELWLFRIRVNRGEMQNLINLNYPIRTSDRISFFFWDSKFFIFLIFKKSFFKFSIFKFLDFLIFGFFKFDISNFNKNFIKKLHQKNTSKN